VIATCTPSVLCDMAEEHSRCAQPDVSCSE